MGFWYNKAATDILSGAVQLNSVTLKVMLCSATYIADRDQDVADSGTGSDAESGEINVANYTKGFGSSSRKPLSNKTFTESDANDRGIFTNGGTNLTWTTFGATITQAVVVRETGVNDTTTYLTLLLDGFSVMTNGGDFTLQFDGTNGLGFLRTA